MEGASIESTKKPDVKVTSIMPWLVAMAFFMQMLDSTIVNTAIPSIAIALGESPVNMQSMIIAYMLTVALLIPASGWLADRLGTRKVFFWAIVVFTLGSVLCAMASSLKMMVLARIIQGIGGSTMAPVGRLAVLRAYPRSQLVQAMSLITMPGLIGPLVGPTVGGLLVQYASWHWIFLINLPVGIVGCALAWRFMPDFKGIEKRGFDFIGFFTFGISMILISLAVSGITDFNFSIPFASGIFLSGIIFLVVYLLHAKKAAAPLFNLKIFRNRSFSVGITGNIFARIGSGAMPFLIPLLLQVGLGFSPAKAGLTLIPMTVASLGAKTIGTPIIRKFGYRKVLVINTTILGCLIASFCTVTGNTPYVLLLAQLFIFGAINSTQFTAMNTLTLVDLSETDAANGNSLLSIVMQIAMSFGVALGAGTLNFFIPEGSVSPNYRTADNTLQQGIQSFQYAFATVGIAAISAAFIFLFTPKNAGTGEDIPISDPH